MTLLARPLTDDWEQSLKEHLTAVAESSHRIIERKTLSFPDIATSDIADIGRILGACHDFGKATTFFQQYIDREQENPYPRNKRHSLISAFYAYHVLSKEFDADRIALLGWLIVQRHHGNLESFFGDRPPLLQKCKAEKDLLQKQAKNIQEHALTEVERIYDTLDINYVSSFLDAVISGDIFEEVIETYYKHDRDKFGENSDNYYLVLFLYSVLLDTDKMNSAGVPFKEWTSVGDHNELAIDLVKRYKEKELSVDSHIDEQREEAFRAVDTSVSNTEDNLLSITLPTGGGKTLTALNAALKIRSREEFRRPPRIIYSLPFLSIIDQNHGVIQDVLDVNNVDPDDPSLLLRHDYMSSGFATETQDETNQLDNPNRALLLTEGWNSEIVTTTFVQFFETLITRRNANARRFHKMANAVIVLDEIQAVPEKYWEGIKTGLETLASRFNSYILLMTATNPLIFEPGEEITELVPDHESYFDVFDRLDYDIRTTDAITLDELRADVESDIDEHPDADVMVVMNTVNSAKHLYHALEDRVDRNCIFLSTNILPKEREDRIEQIKNGDDPLLIITTQLIEAGVDIDIDIVYRDFAPLDSLIQTAGRCNRENTDRGRVTLITIADEDGPRDHFHQYVYDGTLMGATRDTLSNFSSSVTEQEFNRKAVASYFQKVHDRATTDNNTVSNMECLRFNDLDLSLIEQDYETVSIFVKTQESAEVYTRVKHIYDDFERFRRKGELQKVKGEFNTYLLDVRLSGREEVFEHLPPFSKEVSDIRIIDRERIGEGETYWYHPDTGFSVPNSLIQERIV